MLYQTLLQDKIFLVVMYYGIIAGFFFEAKQLICKTFKNNFVVCLILDTLSMLIFAIIFVYAKNIANFGEFRLYILLSFVLGMILEHFSIGFLVEKFLTIVYNLCTKIYRRIACIRPKSKFMQKLFK